MRGLGLALKVYVRLAADVYRDAQALISHREHARLGLDPTFAEADTGLI